MSLDATRWAWEQQGLKASTKLVLLSLADRAGEDHVCYPSTSRLELDTGLYRETIFSATRELEEGGLLVVEKAVGRANRYRLIGVTSRHNPSAFADQSEKAYQSAKADPTSREKPTTTSRQKPTQNLPIEPTKNQSLAKTEKSTSAKRVNRKVQMPPDFDLSPNRRLLAIEHWTGRGRPDLDPDHEFEKFVNHHRSRGSTMADWDAAWKTWYCNAVQYTRPPGGPNYANRQPAPRQTHADRHRQQAAAVISRIEAEQRDGETGGFAVGEDGRPVWPEVDREVG